LALKIIFLSEGIYLLSRHVTIQLFFLKNQNYGTFFSWLFLKINTPVKI
jgi:hypothetical protein